LILINLLPHREERRRQRKRLFFVGLGVAAAGGVLVALAWFGAVQQLTQIQQARNTYLRTEIGRLDGQIKDIASLRTEIEGLKARQRAVEDLQLNRNVPVHLLDELVRMTPEGIYLTSIKQTDGVVQVSGVAQTNERVSEFLRIAQTDSPWLDRMELVEIKAITQPVAIGAREQRRLYEFALRVSIKLPGAAASAPGGVGGAGAAAGPGRAASAPVNRQPA
jgi:type IV pilus assembly protein PilN